MLSTRSKIDKKKHIGNAYDKLAKNALKNIDYVEERLLSNPTSHKFNSWMQRLLKQREKLLLFNKKYWGRRLGRNGSSIGMETQIFFKIEQTLEGRGN